MKRTGLGAFVLCLTLTLVLPFSAIGQDNSNYVSIKGGIYNPTGDLDDIGLGTGKNVEVSFGHYFNPNFALELGTGYFATDETFSGFDPFLLGSFTEKDDISVIPITVTAKGVIPFQMGEFYLGAGLGIYLAEFKADITSSTSGSASLKDDDTVFGLDLLAGLTFNITPKWFLGVEGKYIITSDGTASGVVFGIPITLEGNFDGYTLSGVLGFRF